MRIPQKITWLGLFAGLLLSLGAHAELRLNEQLIQNWMQSIKAMQSLSAEFEALEQQMGATSGSAMPDSATLLNALQGSRVYDDFLKIIRDHGFDTPEAWTEANQRILYGMMAVAMDEAQAQEGMTPEMRQMMANMMPTEVQQVSASDKALLKSQRAQIEAFFEAQSGE